MSKDTKTAISAVAEVGCLRDGNTSLKLTLDAEGQLIVNVVDCGEDGMEAVVDADQLFAALQKLNEVAKAWGFR